MATRIVRKATPDDLPIVQEIARRTIDQSYRSFLGDEGVDWFINSGESDRVFERHLDDCDVTVQYGAIVAFAITFDDLIDLMMVDVDLHRSGFGSHLLAFAEEQLFAGGNETIRLETFEGNQQAINFYLKNGWTETGRKEDPEHGFVRVFFEKST